MNKVVHPDKTLLGKARDGVAYAIARFALRHIATPWYGTTVEGLIKIGMQTVAEDKIPLQVVREDNE